MKRGWLGTRAGDAATLGLAGENTTFAMQAVSTPNITTPPTTLPMTIARLFEPPPPSPSPPAEQQQNCKQAPQNTLITRYCLIQESCAIAKMTA